MGGQIHFIGITPEEFQESIIKGIAVHLEDIKQNSQPKREEYLSKAEVAEMFKVDLKTIDNWCKSGDLKKKRLGGKIYFLRSQIEESLI